MVEKKDKKVKKTQSADTVSSKETRKDRKLSRKRVCMILFHLKQKSKILIFNFSMKDAKIPHLN